MKGGSTYHRYNEHILVSNTAAAAAVVACASVGPATAAAAAAAPVVGIRAGQNILVLRYASASASAAVLARSHHGPVRIPVVLVPGPVRIRTELVLVLVRISVLPDVVLVLAVVVAQASGVHPEDIHAFAAQPSVHGLLLPAHTPVVTVPVPVPVPVGVPASVLTRGLGEHSLRDSDRGETGVYDRCPSTGPHKKHTAAAPAPCPAAPVEHPDT